MFKNNNQNTVPWYGHGYNPSSPYSEPPCADPQYTDQGSGYYDLPCPDPPCPGQGLAYDNPPCPKPWPCETIPAPCEPMPWPCGPGPVPCRICPTGATGPAGASGSAGPMGPAGPAGATGPSGPMGPAGTAAAATFDPSQAAHYQKGQIIIGPDGKAYVVQIDSPTGTPGSSSSYTLLAGETGPAGPAGAAAACIFAQLCSQVTSG